jgi:hypothetical protein
MINKATDFVYLPYFIFILSLWNVFVAECGCCEGF